MYIQRLNIQSVRLIRSMQLDFMRESGPRMWTVLLAENGCCKSTVLQLVALAAAGPTLGAALIEDAQNLVPAKKWRPRAGQVNGQRTQWEADFAPAVTGPGYSPTVSVKPGFHEFTFEERASPGTPLIDLRAKRLPGFFVVGYGVGRFLPRPGEVALPRNPPHDRVEGLFSKHHKVLGTDFYGALLEDSSGAALAFSKALKEALLATGPGDERLFPFLEDVEIRGRDGVKALRRLLETRRFTVTAGGRTMKLPATSLSDGYQSMLAWIADLLGHAYLEKGEIRPAREIEGIALIDELDLHLHPAWQRTVAPILRRLFPKVQFVVTTHSPLLVASMEADEVIRLELGKDGVAVAPRVGPPGLLNTTELLTSYFGIPYAGRVDLRKKLDEYLDLSVEKDLPPGRRTRLEALEEELGPYLTTRGV